MRENEYDNNKVLLLVALVFEFVEGLDIILVGLLSTNVKGGPPAGLTNCLLGTHFLSGGGTIVLPAVIN